MKSRRTDWEGLGCLTLFIAWPWLALVPAVLFLTAFVATRRRLALATSVVWALYALYEFGMKRRWLCSGECNIRIDLLLLYPVLVILSTVAAVIALRAALHRPRPPGP